MIKWWKTNKCEVLGHKWTPVFIKGKYNGKMIKFISCSCDRCGMGDDEVYKIVSAGENREYATYNEKYFHKDEVK